MCLQKNNEWNCIRYNCEHSLLKSIGYTLRNVYARWTKAYKQNVDTFACITDFQRQKLIQAGFQKEHITVIPNSLDITGSYLKTTGQYVAYIGRLSYEKGYDLLIEVAKRQPSIPFYFAGEKREKHLREVPSNVVFTGYLQQEALHDFIQQARIVVIPSRCYEGFPMAILEAAQYGKPTIAPNHGGFTEIIGEGNDGIGRLFRPGDVDSLEEQVIELWNNPQETERLGEQAFEKLKREYSTEVVLRKWEKLFSTIINRESGIFCKNSR